MGATLVDILFGMFMAAAGAVSVLLCRAYARRRTSCDTPAEVQRAREIMTRLHQWTLNMTADVDEHSSRVGEISQCLASQKVPDTDVALTAVGKIVEANEQISRRLVSAEAQLQEQAKIIESQAAEVRTDALTQLANRRAFDDEMARRYSEFKRHGTPVSIMTADLDYFKSLNDSHGHQAGDEVLRGVAGVLHRVAREVDLAARYGGEEFAVILPRTSIEDACMAAERAREAIEQACFRFGGQDLSVTASIGVAQLRPSECPSLLLRRADEALYASKRGGRNNTHWHDGQAVHPVGTLEEAGTEQPRRKSPPESHNDTPAIAATSQVDAVPRLCDRTAFCHIIHRRLAEWERGGEGWSVILAETDNYEETVSQRSPNVAERVQHVVGHTLSSVIREMDLMARYTTNCFAFMLPGTERKQLIHVAEHLHHAVAGCSFSNEDEQTEITLSLGLTQVTEGDDLVRLLRRAEEALRSAKEGGGNGSYYHNGQWPEPVGAAAEVSG